MRLISILSISVPKYQTFEFYKYLLVPKKIIINKLDNNKHTTPNFVLINYMNNIRSDYVNHIEVHNYEKLFEELCETLSNC